MKNLIKTLTALSTLASFSPLSAQDSIRKIVPVPHHGLQVSMFFGGAGGSVHANSPETGALEFKGTTTHFMMHVGYAYKNWATGFTLGFNSLEIKSFRLNNVEIDKGPLSTIDNNLTGIYITRYFMPLNLFATAELGAGKFSISDRDAKVLGETNSGFAWNLKAGKEFLLGAKKRFGVGAYVNLSGITCHDKAPYASDVYSYLAPGFGIQLSYH